MHNFVLLLRLFIHPGKAMGDILHRGSWLFAAAAVLVVSGTFYATINSKINDVYNIPSFGEYYRAPTDDHGAQDPENLRRATAAYSVADTDRPKIPVLGDRFFWLFNVKPSGFYYPLLLLSLFYIPFAIFLTSQVSAIGSFGLALRRDYGSLAICTLNAWAAGHLPFAMVGILLSSTVDPQIFIALWAGGGLLFGLFMLGALRTTFGISYGSASIVVSVAWISMSAGVYAFSFISPWLFSPFILLFVILYFGGAFGGEVRGFGNAFRQKRNLKRFLHNATINPKDADAHVQLGLIQLQRHQESKAREHFRKALEIDESEIDANYELGKLDRKAGELQKALDHFAVVIDMDEKHSLSEVWREIGATYLAADMMTEARNAMETFVSRRPTDAEGLYYMGKILFKLGDREQAKEKFQEAISCGEISVGFRRNASRHWAKLARKELKNISL